jgi:hypothetical protein
VGGWIGTYVVVVLTSSLLGGLEGFGILVGRMCFEDEMLRVGWKMEVGFRRGCSVKSALGGKKGTRRGMSAVSSCMETPLFPLCIVERLCVYLCWDIAI